MNYVITRFFEIFVFVFAIFNLSSDSIGKPIYNTEPVQKVLKVSKDPDFSKKEHKNRNLHLNNNQFSNQNMDPDEKNPQNYQRPHKMPKKNKAVCKNRKKTQSHDTTLIVQVLSSEPKTKSIVSTVKLTESLYVSTTKYVTNTVTDDSRALKTLQEMKSKFNLMSSEINSIKAATETKYVTLTTTKTYTTTHEDKKVTTAEKKEILLNDTKDQNKENKKSKTTPTKTTNEGSEYINIIINTPGLIKDSKETLIAKIN